MMAGTDRNHSNRPGHLLFRCPRSAPGWLLVLTLCAALAAAVVAACASDRPASAHPDLAPVWRDYLEFPAERAMAIAGDPRRDRWVVGAVGGHTTKEEAAAAAHSQCLERRARRRIQAACIPYAVGDEVVWRRR
jgi:hypothetical protein